MGELSAAPTTPTSNTSAACVGAARRRVLLRWGFALEGVTLVSNVVGVGVLLVAVLCTRSVALAGFGLDSVIEIVASIVVIWELSVTGGARQTRSLRHWHRRRRRRSVLGPGQAVWGSVVGFGHAGGDE